MRRLREMMGLSQRDLARWACVTNATISMIDHNKQTAIAATSSFLKSATAA